MYVLRCLFFYCFFVFLHYVFFIFFFFFFQAEDGIRDWSVTGVQTCALPIFVPKVAVEKVAGLAVEAREQMKLRHVPLLLVREMARHKTHRALVSETLARVIQRADELAEFVAIYWKDGKAPLSGQVKKGLAAAFPKFDEYQLAKYDRGGPIKLRDVLFLCHAKPRDAAQAGVWKKLTWGRLNAPDTWEVTVSSGASGTLARGADKC